MQHRMQIEFDGLIGVLAKHLYTDPSIFIRELIQNGHDAIRKRQLFEKKQKFNKRFQPRIHVSVHPETASICFKDNGAGLSLDDIHRYLSSIGASNKESGFMVGSPNDYPCIGQFGIGLLSCFLVAKRMEIRTTNLLGESFLWSHDGSSIHYDVEEIYQHDLGTSVTLFLQPEQQRYLNTHVLDQHLRTYGDIVGIPIYLDQRPKAVNVVDAPWHLKCDDEQLHLERCDHFWQVRKEGQHPLASLALKASFQYCDVETQKIKTGVVKGILAIRDQVRSHHQGVCDVFIHRMFIGANQKGVLPLWASFVDGIIESHVLTPSMARDEVIQNAALVALQKTIATHLLEWLERLDHEQPELFERILKVHHLAMMSMCLLTEHQALFYEVAERIPLESSAGSTCLRTYLDKVELDETGRKTVLYSASLPSLNQYSACVPTQHHNLIYAPNHMIQSFLSMYADACSKVVLLKELNVKNDDVLEAVTGEQKEACASLQALCESSLPIQTVMSLFQASDVPAFIVETEQCKAQKHILGLLETPGVSTEILEIMDKFSGEKKEISTLHLNMNHPLIQTMALNAASAIPLVKDALKQLYQQALLLQDPQVHVATLKEMGQQATQSLSLLFEASEAVAAQGEKLQHLELLLEVSLEKEVKHQDKSVMS
ncbi:MAG: ATP-binding protein [Mariprofundaceae bacterium]|nr:ATP-binding protein [Mariprofundaceae bacterium]